MRVNKKTNFYSRLFDAPGAALPAGRQGFTPSSDAANGTQEFKLIIL